MSRSNQNNPNFILNKNITVSFSLHRSKLSELQYRDSTVIYIDVEINSFSDYAQITLKGDYDEINSMLKKLDKTLKEDPIQTISIYVLIHQIYYFVKFIEKNKIDCIMENIICREVLDDQYFRAIIRGTKPELDAIIVELFSSGFLFRNSLDNNGEK